MSLEGKISLGIEARVQGGMMSVQSAIAWYWVWAQSSIDRYEAARAARARLLETPDGQRHLPMMDEFHASLHALAACAFSLEALSNDVCQDKAIAAIKSTPPKPSTRDLNRGDYIAALLGQLCHLSAKQEAVGDLFALRNAAVHPEFELAPSPFHAPIGSHVPAPITKYTVDAAGTYLEILKTVFSDLISSNETLPEAWIRANRAHLQQIVDRVSSVLSS